MQEYKTAAPSLRVVKKKKHVAKRKRHAVKSNLLLIKKKGCSKKAAFLFLK